MADEEWLDVELLANELRVPERTVRSWRARGKGPRGYKINGLVRFRRRDVDAWLERQADPEMAA